MQHTTNYSLSQWEADDVVRREDVNADNAKLDAAIKAVSDAAAGKAHIEALTYTGSGGYGKDNPTICSFRSKPALVVIISINSFHIMDDAHVLSITRDSDQIAHMRRAGVTWDGNTVIFHSISDPAIQANEANVQYEVVALCF